MESNWPNGRPEDRTVGVQPEILPPLEMNGAGRSANEPAATSRRGWASAPATYLLVGINITAFVVMALKFSTTSPNPDQLLRFGANNGGEILANGEWWRLVTATFVHAGPLHIATNMWCLWNLGLLGEPLLGGIGMVLVYLATGIAGNLLSIAINPESVGVGASGAVFGLAGVLIVLLKSKLLPVPEFELKRLRRSVIYFAVLNFVLGAGTMLIPSVIRIDQMAHLGGFLSGLAIGVPLVPKIGAPRAEFIRKQWIAFAGAALSLALLAYGIFSYARPA